MKIRGILQGLSLGLLIVISVSCRQEADEYVRNIRELRSRHISSLRSENGWLNLAGLYWLGPGVNSFGSDPANDVVFPVQAPAMIGTFYLDDSSNVRVNIKEGVTVTCNGKPVHDTLLIPDTEKGTTILQTGSLRWFVIRRGEMTGIRLRDLEHPALREFDTIPAWEIDPAWRIPARFVPFEKPVTVQVPNVLGTTFKGTSPGLLYFNYRGKQYTLQPTGEPDDLFVVFADKTSGKESYGSGRFLPIDGPDDHGNYTIDFNKAYNPPCAFTPYATCPVPMKENILPFAVTAGEKVDPAWHGHH